MKYGLDAYAAAGWKVRQPVGKNCVMSQKFGSFERGTVVILQNNFNECEFRGGGVTKGHQLQIFLNYIFELLGIEKA